MGADSPEPVCLFRQSSYFPVPEGFPDRSSADQPAGPDTDDNRTPVFRYRNPGLFETIPCDWNESRTFS